MDVAILVIWSVGLLIALTITLVILKHVFLVLAELSAIQCLAEIIREAARGVAANSGQFSALAPLDDSAAALREGGRQQSASIASAARELETWLGE